MKSVQKRIGHCDIPAGIGRYVHLRYTRIISVVRLAIIPDSPARVIMLFELYLNDLTFRSDPLLCYEILFFYIFISAGAAVLFAVQHPVTELRHRDSVPDYLLFQVKRT